MPAYEYCARVLEVICRTALHHCGDGAARLVNYAQLPQAQDDVVMPHFRLDCTTAERAHGRGLARSRLPSFESVPPPKAGVESVLGRVQFDRETGQGGQAVFD